MPNPKRRPSRPVVLERDHARPRSLPALLKARRMTEKAAALGLVWGEVAPPDGAVARALAQAPAVAHHALARRDKQEVATELGEALFFLADLARRLGIDPEAALQATNEEFARRFAAVEDGATEYGTSVRELDPSARAELWLTPSGGGSASGPAGGSPPRDR